MLYNGGPSSIHLLLRHPLQQPFYVFELINGLRSMDDRGSHAIIIITALFLFLSLVAVSLRCFVRLKIVKMFGRDDALMVTAMVSRHTQSVMHSTHLDLDLQYSILHV